MTYYDVMSEVPVNVKHFDNLPTEFFPRPFPTSLFLLRLLKTYDRWTKYEYL